MTKKQWRKKAINQQNRLARMGQYVPKLPVIIAQMKLKAAQGED